MWWFYQSHDEKALYTEISSQKSLRIYCKNLWIITKTTLLYLFRSTNLLIGLVVLYLVKAFKWSLNCHESFTIIPSVITITNTQLHSFLHLFQRENAIKLYCLFPLKYDINLKTIMLLVDVLKKFTLLFQIQNMIERA